MAKYIDLTGTTIGTYKVVSRHMGDGSYKYRKESHWNCVCECGEERVCRAGSIKRGALEFCPKCDEKIVISKDSRDERFTNANKGSKDFTGNPKKYPQGFFKNKPCRLCKTVFSPLSPSHLYCSDTCADKAHDGTYLKRVYGITIEQYDEMFKIQGGVCKICKKEGEVITPKHKMTLVVDHCHEKGHVRGLLCHKCNKGLGLFHDSIEDLKRAIKYLS